MKTTLRLLFLFSCLTFSVKAQTKFSRQFWRITETTAANIVEQTSDSGYIMAGSIKDTITGSLTDVFLARFNSLGDTVWTKRMGGSGSDVGYAVQQTYD